MQKWRSSRTRLTIEHLEERILLHGDPGYDLAGHVHQQLSIFVNDAPVAIPTDIGVTDTDIIANPHTHDDDGVLHYHPLNGQPASDFPTLGDFFTVWRTNAGNAGNNPNATFSSTELMGNVTDATHRVLMYVNGAANFDYENYTLRDGDQIVLSYETIPGPNDPFLQPIGNLTAAAGKPLFVPLNATDPQGDALTYTVTTSDSRVQATVLQGDRLLRLDVSGTDHDGNPFTGTMLLYLFESLVPNTTARIIQLTQNGFYDGLTFHRIIDGFMIQGGDPNGDGTGGSGLRFDDEFRPELTFTGFGQLAMANAGDDTNDSQFFITDTNLSLNMQSSPTQLPPQHLNFQHTIFGQLVSGFDVYEKIITTPTDASDRPVNTVTITDASIVNDPGRAVLMLSPQADFTGDVTVEVTVTDPQGNSDFRRFNLRVVADSVNDPPFLGAVNDLQTLEETPVQFTITATDLENDPLTFVVRDPFTFQPSNAVDVNLTDNGDGTATVTLTPRTDVTGLVQLLVGVRDQTARGGLPLEHRNQYDTQRINLTITPVNDAPTAQDLDLNTPQDTPLDVQLVGDDGDPDANQTLSFEIVSQPEHGTITNFDPSTGTLTYTPDPGFVGTDSFTYRVTDDGGTDNGGQDTSQTATVSISVGPVPATPIGLGLSRATDTGSRGDGYTRHPLPVLRVRAEAGKTVHFMLNGTDLGPAEEVRSGVYEFRLNPARHPLRLGANQVTAYAVDNNRQSSQTPPLQLVWAPSYSQTYVVPGEPGTRTRLTFRLTHRIAAYANEVGLVVADGPGGKIDGVRPGTDRYTEAALRSASRRTLFAPDDAVGTRRTLSLPAGAHVVFYLVQNATAQRWLAERNGDNDGDAPVVFFSVTAANPDGVDHVRQTVDPYTGSGQYFWEDLWGGGDRDFNDLVFEVQPEDAAPGHRVIRAAGPQGAKVSLRARLRRPAQGDDGTTIGELGLFQLDGPDGTVGGSAPGSSDYLRRVFNSARVKLFDAGSGPGARSTVELDAGAVYGIYYVLGGTLEEAVQQNPSNDPVQEPVVLFSFDAANPGGAELMRWFEPERAGVRAERFQRLDDDVLRLHLVDQVLAGDQDWVDAVLVELMVG